MVSGLMACTAGSRAVGCVMCAMCVMCVIDSMSTVVTCRIFSTHGFKASYSLVEAGMGGTSVRVLKYTVPSDATSRSSAKMISEPGFLEAVRLTRFASMVVRPLVPFTSTKPCKQKQHAVLLSHAHGSDFWPGTGSPQTLHNVNSKCVNACIHACVARLYLLQHCCMHARIRYRRLWHQTELCTS